VCNLIYFIQYKVYKAEICQKTSKHVIQAKHLEKKQANITEKTATEMTSMVT